jgi:hypothetical protein
MRKQLKRISDGGDSGNKKCKRGYGRAYDGRRLKLVFGSVLVHLAGIWLVIVKMFSHLIYLT